MTPCSVANCTQLAKGQDLCARHLRNYKNYGHARSIRETPLYDRAAARGWTVRDGCWEYDGRRNQQGYGILNHVRVHRIVFEHHNGALAPGLIVRHTCDNPPCVNPDHLLAGTKADNMADMVERQRHFAHGRTHCPNGHDLSLPDAIKRSPRGENLCITCDRDRKRRYWQRKNAA